MSDVSELLEDEQKKNLDFLESFGEALPGVKGVPIIVGLSYEAVQFFNMVALSGSNILKKPEGEESACPSQ